MGSSLHVLTGGAQPEPELRRHRWPLNKLELVRSALNRNVDIFLSIFFFFRRIAQTSCKLSGMHIMYLASLLKDSFQKCST